MLLFKCKCGCHFTINNIENQKEDYFKLICNNCKEHFVFGKDNSFSRNMDIMKEHGFEMYILPDNTKLDLSSSL